MARSETPNQAELHAVEELLGFLQDLYKPVAGVDSTRPRAVRPSDIDRPALPAAPASPPPPSPQRPGQPNMHDVLASLGLLVALQNRPDASQHGRALQVLQSVVQEWVDAHGGTTASASPAGSVNEFFNRASDHIQRLGSLLPGRAAASEHEDAGPTLFE